MLNFTSRIAQLLHQDHYATVEVLQNLDGFLVRQGDRKVPDLAAADTREVLAGVSGVARHEVGRHFTFEEEQLFPLLAEAGEIGMTTLLKYEHAAILPVAQELGRIADAALASGTLSAEDWREFHRLGQELVERELFHIQKEEMALLAAVNALVPPEVDARLAEMYAALAA